MDVWSNKTEKKLIPLLKDTVVSEDGDLDFFFSKLNLESFKPQVFEILTELHYCDCCVRHQFNKPCVPHKWVNKKDATQNFAMTCWCDCRHTARMICRMCD